MTASSICELTPQLVEHVPEEMVDGVLYISKRFGVIMHRCCCGCGSEVVTHLGGGGWQAKEESGLVSLTPSIGNYQIPCKSHYWIENNKVRWA